MSKRNARNKIKLGILDEINQIDRRLKKSKIRNSEEESSKLMSKRNIIEKKNIKMKNRSKSDSMMFLSLAALCLFLLMLAMLITK